MACATALGAVAVDIGTGVAMGMALWEVGAAYFAIEGAEIGLARAARLLTANGAKKSVRRAETAAATWGTAQHTLRTSWADAVNRYGASALDAANLGGTLAAVIIPGGGLLQSVPEARAACFAP
jgi:hypothetical protein